MLQFINYFFKNWHHFGNKNPLFCNPRSVIYLQAFCYLSCIASMYLPTCQKQRHSYVIGCAAQNVIYLYNPAAFCVRMKSGADLA